RRSTAITLIAMVGWDTMSRSASGLTGCGTPRALRGAPSMPSAQQAAKQPPRAWRQPPNTIGGQRNSAKANATARGPRTSERGPRRPDRHGGLAPGPGDGRGGRRGGPPRRPRLRREVLGPARRRRVHRVVRLRPEGREGPPPPRPPPGPVLGVGRGGRLGRRRRPRPPLHPGDRKSVV